MLLYHQTPFHFPLPHHPVDNKELLIQSQMITVKYCHLANNTNDSMILTKPINVKL